MSEPTTRFQAPCEKCSNTLHVLRGGEWKCGECEAREVESVRRAIVITCTGHIMRDRTSYGYQEYVRVQTDALKPFDGKICRVTIEVDE